jgi:hypothetical protein
MPHLYNTETVPRDFLVLDMGIGPNMDSHYCGMRVGDNQLYNLVNFKK